MNLNKVLLINNSCYKEGKTIIPKGIMVHSTGANNPYLKRYVQPNDGKLGTNAYGNHWNVPKPDNQKKCVHAFIGKLSDGSIATYQTLPWNHRGWHGGGSSNDYYIGFEICEDSLKDSTYFNAVYKEAIELCAYLCKLYKFDPLGKNVIICHSEGAKLDIASDHADVMHWFPKHGKTMDDFRGDVDDLVNGTKNTVDNKVTEDYKLYEVVNFLGGKHYPSANSNKGTEVSGSRAKITAVSLTGKHKYHVRAVNQAGNYVSGVYGWVDSSSISKLNSNNLPYIVKVNASNLTVRKFPNDKSQLITSIKDKGVYTIVEEVNGWGRLKSNIGWIKLSYTTKLK